MKTQLKCNVVMLPTEKASACIQIRSKTGVHHPKYPEGYISFITQQSRGTLDPERYWIGQHLYFISDREIKEGDWYIHNQKPNGLRIYKCTSIAIPMDAKKIEATTDPSICSPHPSDIGMVAFQIPQIPESFIQAYVKANGDIKDVMIEIERVFGVHTPDFSTEVKTRPDNTVIIHQSKTYTRDEVKIKLENLINAINLHNENDKLCNFIFQDWIEENL